MSAAVAPLAAAVDSAPVELASRVERARHGDRRAWGELYLDFRRAVHAVVLARVPHADAGDLVQDVFEVALRQLGELDEPAAFGGWLLTIARHRAIDHARRLRRAPIDATAPPDEEFAVVEDGALPGHRLDTQRALAAIRALPTAYQETLLMRLVFGLTGPQIAAQTGLAPGSVRVNLHRGMQQLRRVMGVPATPEEPR